MAGENLNEGIFVLARNVIGITGIGLLTSLVTGGLLAWTLPMGYMAFCQYALLEAWRAPWTWPVRPPSDRGAWIAACVVYAVGLLLFTVRGPPAPVRTAARSPDSVRNRSNAAYRARLVGTSIALAFGRSTVMTSTGPSARIKTPTEFTLRTDAGGTGR